MIAQITAKVQTDLGRTLDTFSFELDVPGALHVDADGMCGLHLDGWVGEIARILEHDCPRPVPTENIDTRFVKSDTDEFAWECSIGQWVDDLNDYDTSTKNLVPAPDYRRKLARIAATAIAAMKDWDAKDAQEAQQAQARLEQQRAEQGWGESNDVLPGGL